jgi:phage gp29-like protein
VPAGAQPEEAEDFYEDLANIGSEAAVRCPVGENGGAFDVEFVEATARTWDAFTQFKKCLDVDIAVRVLGQNLTTEAAGSNSARAASTHELVRLDKAFEDASIGDVLSKQLLGWYAEYNYDDRELAPIVKYHVEPPNDLNAEATGLKALGDALVALKAAHPRVDLITILEAQGIPLLTEEELAAIEAEVAAKRAAEAAANPQPPPVVGTPPAPGPGNRAPAAGAPPAGAAPAAP